MTFVTQLTHTFSCNYTAKIHALFYKPNYLINYFIMSNTTSLIIPFNKSIGKGRHSLSSIHSHCEETCMKYGINHLNSG